MLAYLSIGIALYSVTVCLAFGLTWAYLGHEIRHSSLLQEEFRTAVRRLIGTIGIFVIPVGVYFLDGTKQYANNAEPFAFAWGACYAVSLLILVRSLITLMRDGNHEGGQVFTIQAEIVERLLSRAGGVPPRSRICTARQRKNPPIRR